MATPRNTDARLPRVTRQSTFAPVDTYVKPDGSQASQLAAALSEFQPKLARFSQELMTRDNEQKLQAGIAEAQKMQAAGRRAGELTRSGDLAMQDNAWFKAGLEEEQGRIGAGMWRSDFLASEEFAGVKDSTSLEDFDKAATKFNSRFATGTDGASKTEFYQRGFGTLQNNYQAAARYEFATGIEGKLGAQTDATLHARAKQIIQDETRKGVDGKTIGEALNTLAKQYEVRGRPAKFVRAAMADALDHAARNAEDPYDGLQLMYLWDEVQGEGGKTLGDDKYGAEQKEKLKSDLTARLWQKENHDASMVKEQEQNLVSQGMQEFSRALAANPTETGTKLLNDPRYRNVRHILVDAYANMGRQNHAVVFQDNEWTMRNTLSRILNPEIPGPKVDEVLISGLNLSNEGKIQLLGQLAQVKAARGNGVLKRLYDDEMIAQERKAAEKYFHNNITGIVPSEKEDKVMGVMASYDIRVLAQLESGRFDKASNAEKRAWLRDTMSALGNSDKGIMGNMQVSPVKQYQFDPNQPELGPIPKGGPARPLGASGGPEAPSGGVPSDAGSNTKQSSTGQSDAGSTVPEGNPYANLPLQLDPLVLRGALHQGTPGYDAAISDVFDTLVGTGLFPPGTGPTPAQIQFYIDAQLAQSNRAASGR